MSRFFYFIAGCMIVAGLLIGGCRKDSKEDELSISKYENPFYQKHYNDAIFSNNKVKTRTNNPEIDALISKVYTTVVHKNINDRISSISNIYGYPIWTVTEFVTINSGTVTITPIYHSQKKEITNFLITNSNNSEIYFLAHKLTSEIDFFLLKSYFNNVLAGNENISMKGTGVSGGYTTSTGGPTYALDCVQVINVTWIFDTTLLDGANTDQGNEYEISPDEITIINNFNGGVTVTSYAITQNEQICDWVEYTGGNNDLFEGTDAGGTAGGGFGSQTNTWIKCMNYIKEKTEKDFSPQDESTLKSIYDHCGGCMRVFVMSLNPNSLQKYMTGSLKRQCAMCRDNSTGLSVINAWDYISFPCGDVDKDALLDELLPECGVPDAYQQLSWDAFKEKLGNKTWILKVIGNDKGSEDLNVLTNVLGISRDKQKSMTDEDLCNAVRIAECLKPNQSGYSMDGYSDEGRKGLIDFYKNAILIDPCTGQNIDKYDLLSALCEQGNLNMSGLNELLEGNPFIKVSPNLATDCPKLNCILNTIISGGESTSDFLCNMLDQFDGNPTIGIRATLPKLGEPNFLGKTQVLNGKDILISFNKNNCILTDVLDLFETFQHELVHADFYRQLFEDYSWTGDYLTLDETFRKLVEFHYGINATPDQHILMLNELLPDMINSLMQANGSNILCNGTETYGDCFHFKTLIINGFSEHLIVTELGIPFDLHRNNMALYNSWKLSQPLFNQLNSCL